MNFPGRGANFGETVLVESKAGTGQNFFDKMEIQKAALQRDVLGYPVSIGINEVLHQHNALLVRRAAGPDGIATCHGDTKPHCQGQGAGRRDLEKKASAAHRVGLYQGWVIDVAEVDEPFLFRKWGHIGVPKPDDLPPKFLDDKTSHAQRYLGVDVAVRIAVAQCVGRFTIMQGTVPTGRVQALCDENRFGRMDIVSRDHKPG